MKTSFVHIVQQAKEQLRNSEQGSVLRSGSWEEELVRIEIYLKCFERRTVFLSWYYVDNM